jgi:hypothetical protein
LGGDAPGPNAATTDRGNRGRFVAECGKPALGDATELEETFRQTFRSLRLVIASAMWENARMPPENYCYAKVVLNDNMPVDDSLSAREIQLIVGSPSKISDAALTEFASEFTRHTRMSQGWGTVHAIVEPMEFKELPPLGDPTHTEGNLSAWLVE